MADSAGAMQRRGLVDGPDFEFFQRRYFTPAEVAEHNLPEDLWVSYLGSVYDLTPLAQEHKGEGRSLDQGQGVHGSGGGLGQPALTAAAPSPGDLLLKPIIEVAGQDISHWFDPKTRDVSPAGPRVEGGVGGEAGVAGVGGADCPSPLQPPPQPSLKIRKHVDPLTGTLRYRTPRGRFLHVPPQLPRSDWANDFGKPWWQGTRYEVGRLSAKTRSIRIINTLTSQEHTLEVRTGACGQVGGNWGSQQVCQEIFGPLGLRRKWEQDPFPPIFRGDRGGRTTWRAVSRVGTLVVAGSQGTETPSYTLATVVAWKHFQAVFWRAVAAGLSY